jgi:hypothetical protein
VRSAAPWRCARAARRPPSQTRRRCGARHGGCTASMSMSTQLRQAQRG